MKTVEAWGGKQPLYGMTPFSLKYLVDSKISFIFVVSNLINNN